MSFDPMQFKACLTEMRDKRREWLRYVPGGARLGATETLLAENDIELLDDLIAAVEASTK